MSDVNETVILRANAMLSELKVQMNALVDRCATLAAENVLLAAEKQSLAAGNSELQGKIKGLLAAKQEGADKCPT